MSWPRPGVRAAPGARAGSRPAAAATLLGSAAVAGLVLVAAVVDVGGDAVRRASDAMWPLGTVDPAVVVVGVDVASQSRIGPWPWSPQQQADLLAAITGAGAVAVGYDVLPVDPSGTLPPEVTAVLGETGVAAQGFAAAVRGDEGLLHGVGPLAVVGPGVVAGHVVVTGDRGGTVRTVPAVVVADDGTLLPAFPLRLAAVAAGTGRAPTVVRPGAVQVGAVTVRVEDDAMLRIAWAGGGGAAGAAAPDVPAPLGATAAPAAGPVVLSAVDVLEGGAGAALEGAVVLVGVIDPALGDMHATPPGSGATTPGVVVHAHVLDTILQRSWTAPAPPWSSALLVLAFGALAAHAASRWRWPGATLAVLGSVAASAVVGVVLFPVTGWLPDLVRVPGGVLACAGIGLAARVVIEQLARRRTVALFSRYVPHRVAEQLLGDGGESRTDAGVRTEVAVLFCDLRAFTTLAERLDADRVRAVLDAYYAYVCAEAFARDGTVMQFVGDEVFVVFGAPVPMADPAAAARRAARGLVLGATDFEAGLVDAGLPAVRFGIGVHVGTVVAATVGPPRRRQFSVVGDVVNAGSRLCGSAGPGEVVISVQAADGDPAWVGAPRETAALRGREGVLEVLRVEAGHLTGEPAPGRTTAGGPASLSEPPVAAP